MEIMIEIIADIVLRILAGMWHDFVHALPYGIPLAVVCKLIYDAFGKHHWLKQAAKNSEAPSPLVKKQFTAEVASVKAHCKTFARKRMRFACVMPLGKLNTLDMSASFRFTKLIAYSPVWLYYMFGLEDEAACAAWKIAFQQSVGHELGHQFDKRLGLRWLSLSAEEKKLFCWLREVRCDLFSLRFLHERHGFGIAIVLRGLDLKIDAYTNGDQDKKDRFSKTHPSWTVRREIMERYPVITKEVIDLLAARTSCSNEFINEMYELYEAVPAENAIVR